MTQKQLILERDRIAAHQQIQELEAEIEAMAPDIQEALDQSSETWHDNAPFEVLRDRQTYLMNEIRNIKEILYASTSQLPRQNADTVNVAARVQVRNAKTNKRSSYYIAGDWSPNSGKSIQGCMVISRKSPIAAAMIGRKQGDVVAFNGLRLQIEQIDPGAYEG